MKRSYLALVYIFALMSIVVKGQIVYTDIEPDTVIKATVQQGVARFNIDLNNDGTVDYYVKHFHPLEGYREAEFYTNIGQKGEVLVDSNDSPLALDLNDVISSSENFWVNRATDVSSSALFMSDNWAGKLDKYVGVRIKLNGQWHYGWVLISVPADTSEIIVKGFAYEKSENSPINAGGIGTGVPEGNIQKLSSISVYPNPFLNEIKLDLGMEYEKVHFTIFNTDGKVIMRKEVEGNQIISLKIDQPVGIFFVRISSGEEVRILKLFKSF